VDDRVEAKNGQHHESEVIIRSHDHPLPRRTGILGRPALGVVRCIPGSAHFRWDIQVRVAGAYRKLQVVLVIFGQILPIIQANERAPGFVFDRGNAGYIDLIVPAGARARGAIPIQVDAIGGIILTG